MNCPLCEKVQSTNSSGNPFLIHEYENSYLYLGEHQFYLGYCVLVTKNHYREMTDLPPEIQEKVFQEMMTTQKIIQAAFRPKKMNLCSLGNVVDHVHWHFFPRYAEDENFKNPPWLQMQHFEDARITPQRRDELIAMVKTYFDQM